MVTPRSSALAAELDRLVGAGLERYRRGDVDGALAAWEEVLAVAPGNLRAAGYVDYVRAHYDSLVGLIPAPLTELLLPFGLDGNDPSSEYEVSVSYDGGPGERLAEPAVEDGWGIELELAPVAPPSAGAQGSSPTIELDADEPPLRAVPMPVRAPGVSTFGDDDATSAYQGLRRMPSRALSPLAFDLGDDSGEATFGSTRGPGPIELDLELGPSLLPVSTSSARGADFDREPSAELTIERAPKAARPSIDLDAATEDGLSKGRTLPVAAPTSTRPASLDVPTRDLSARAAAPPPRARISSSPPLPASQRPTAQLGPMVLPSIAELSLELDPSGDDGGLDMDRAARELGIEDHVPALDPPALAPPPSRHDDAGAVSVEELRLPPPPGRAKPVDDDEHRAPVVARAGTTGLALQLLGQADRDRRPGESVDDTARRRIGWLIERARTAAIAGEHELVAAAIDLALAESPDSAVAQKLVHKHRETLLDCYYRYFGALDRRPLACGDIAAVAPGSLEPRAAFLWSRIDGMMTYDELLDVAGMGRLEACRHLALLMRRGLVRSQS